MAVAVVLKDTNTLAGQETGMQQCHVRGGVDWEDVERKSFKRSELPLR